MLYQLPASLNDLEFVAFISLIIGTLVFIPYWFLYASEKLSNQWKQKSSTGTNENFIIYTKYAGFTLLGIVPFVTSFVVFPASINVWKYTGLVVESTQWMPILYWTLAVGLPILILSYFSSGSLNFQAKYPEIRKTEWTKKSVVNYAVAWFFYLLGYEYLFRGILFLAIVPMTGFWLAMAINVSIYSISHIPKGQDEAWGAFVIGVVMCFSAWYTKTIWPAFFVHIFMAWSGNYFALRRNKSMKIVGS